MVFINKGMQSSPVVLDIALRDLDLVCTLQCLVETLDQQRHTVGRVQALVRVHMP